MTLLSTGLSAPDLALLLCRSVPGIFFALSGYHKLFNRERHASLVATLTHDNVPLVRFNQWWVPGVEFLGGTLLVLGVLSALCATLLAVVCIVACFCEAPSKVAAYHPVNKADALDDYLYLPEVVYLLMLTVVIIAGPGAYAIL